jgi:hypothetical protein
MESNKHFYFTFPIPLYIFQEVLDSIIDFLSFACLFAPKRTSPNSSSVSIYAVKDLILMSTKLLDSLTEGEPYDLVDVTADKVKVSIKIR